MLSDPTATKILKQFRGSKRDNPSALLERSIYLLVIYSSAGRTQGNVEIELG